ncbi:MAG: hypothetical protein QXY16_01345 [Nanopusillaceae archaeon]
MPSKILETVLITLTLFFIYTFSINLFQSAILNNTLEEEINQYILNNFILCVLIANNSYGSFKCTLSFEYPNVGVVSEGNFFAIRQGSNYLYSEINLSFFLNKGIYGISNRYFILKNNGENITIN